MADISKTNDIDLSREEEDCLRALTKVQSLNLFVRLSGGYSGAKVFLAVTSVGSESQPTYVVKVEHLKGYMGAEDHPDEADRHRRAEDSTIKENIPGLVDVSRHGPWRAYVYEVAGHRIRSSMNLNDLLARSNQGVIAAQTVRDLLAAWNHESRLDVAKPFETIRNTVENYRFKDILDQAKRLHVYPDSQLLFYTGSSAALPNPIAYSTREELWTTSAVERIVTPIGRVHGDLHGGNILIVPGKGQNLQAYIIDFAQYDEARHQFFDLAYLELSLLLHHLDPDASEQNRKDWITVTEFLCAVSSDTPLVPTAFPRPLGSLPDVLCELRKLLITETKRRKQGEDFETGYCLAAVAAALNFFRKGSSHWKRKAALLYGGCFLRTALQQLGIAYHNTAEIPRMVSWLKPDDTNSGRCSFCNKPNTDLELLIMGPGGVFICNECVDLCTRVITDERKKRVSRVGSQ